MVRPLNRTPHHLFSKGNTSSLCGAFFAFPHFLSGKGSFDHLLYTSGLAVSAIFTCTSHFYYILLVNR